MRKGPLYNILFYMMEVIEQSDVNFSVNVACSKVNVPSTFKRSPTA